MMTTNDEEPFNKKYLFTHEIIVRTDWHCKLIKQMEHKVVIRFLDFE